MKAYSEDLRQKVVQAIEQRGIGAAISTVTAKDARGFFEHCGYGPLVQSL